MALHMPVKKLIEMIGHDGSEEPYRELPGQKAGFHEQECINVCQQLGYACTPIEIVPQMIPVSGGPVRSVWFLPEGQSDWPGTLRGQLIANLEDWNWRRFIQHLKDTRGVLTGEKKRIGSNVVVGHAVAWSGMIYDSQGKGFIYSLENAHQYGFVPRTYWKIQEIMNGRGRKDGSFNTSTEKA
jgi:hypothetical protein